MTYQREVRLGMVLYGGVSLAVYENGIAQEIHHAIRGDGVYGLLAKLIDSDIVVDIISGTSAGGVNGIMLAYALANRRTFAPCAKLWLEDGDIQALLRKQNDQDPSSLLDSTYYQDRLESCYGQSLLHDDTAPKIGELDLFVTSTDANGAISTVFDDLGHAVDIKNHRALFQLSYRGERKNDLKAPAADLAKLSRMTSCFPVAFKPVELTAADTNFFRWGRLRHPAIFLDGGILNNKPFTSTINAIANRTSTREVERFLIYVEPKPEQFDSNAPLPPPPSIAQAAVNSLVSIPGYQSIAADLQAIETHNVRAARLQQIFSAMPDAPDASADNLLNAAILLPKAAEEDAEAYYTARYIQIRDAAVSGVLDDSNGRGYFPTATPAEAATKQDDRRSARILVQSFDAWPGEGASTLLNFDVFYRIRRTFHLRKALMRTAKSGVIVPDEAWATVNHYFKLYEMTRWAMMRRLMLSDLKWQNLSAENPTLDTQSKEAQQTILTGVATTMWGRVIELMTPFMRASIPVPITTTHAAREDFYQLLKAQNPEPGLPQAVLPQRDTNILDAIDTAFKQALIALQTSPATASIAKLLCNEFCRFLDVDCKTFLLQVGSNFESTDLIRVVRFSPLDAQRGLSAGPVDQKVRGIALGAFGGFFKKSWRANDIMMGRFDASCLLIECLLTRERLAALAPRRKQNPITITCDELQQYLPSLKDDAAALDALLIAINLYLDDPNNATIEQWNHLINRIVTAYHNEVFAEEYPRVIQCAIEQQYAWGRYRQTTKPSSAAITDLFHPDNLVWTQAKQRPDQTIVEAASIAIATGAVKPFAPGLRPPNAFTEEIPESILQELGSLATYRFSKGLLDSIPHSDLRQRVSKSRLWNVPFNVLAPLSYRWSRMRRTQPDSVIIFNTATPVLCLTILIVEAILVFVLHRQISWTLGAEVAIPTAIVFWLWYKFFRG